MKKLFLVGSVLMFLSGVVAVAHADTFTLTGSLGEKYALDATQVSGDTYDIFLTIDASSLTGTPATTELGDVSVKVSSKITGLTFISAPSGYPSSGLEEGGLNSGGCKASTTNGFFCFAGSAPAGSTGDVYTFEVQATLAGPLDLGSDTGSIKDQFFDAAGRVTEQLSEDTVINAHTTPPVPEPSSLALLGSGVLGLAGVVRRRFSR